MERSTDWIVITVFVVVFALVLLSVVYWSLRNGISPMPTSSKARRRLLSALPKDVSGTIYELGSGWGTLVFPLARHYPHCRVVGYETSWIPFWISKLRQFFMRLPNLELQRRDFYQMPLQDAGLVVCYLYPGAMRLLSVKLSEELKPGTWVISNTFSLPGWLASDVLEVGDLYYSKIYVYRCAFKH